EWDSSRRGRRSSSQRRYPLRCRSVRRRGRVGPSRGSRGGFMATATAGAAETVRAPFFSTKAVSIIAFTATLIFSQNMLSVSSQIGVGDWEFWIDWKDYAWAPFVFPWLVAIHFLVYSCGFNKFFKIHLGATLVPLCWFLQHRLIVQL